MYSIFQGREYISQSNKIIPAKNFEPVQSCCLKQCFQTVDTSQQQDFYNAFWKSAGSYKSQNILLSGLMKRKPSSTFQKTQDKVILWEYCFHFVSEHVTVCQKFLCSLLKISRGRFGTIQKKVINNQSLNDDRGKHNNHVLRFSDELKEMIYEHCSLLPHSESHYSRESSKLLYFDDSSLTLCKLYKSFIEYYTSKTGNSDPPITESSYSKYFNHSLNFTFSKPRTDVCNFCFEHKNTGEINVELKNHKDKVENYRCLKNSMLAEKNVLWLEFDFGQNLPLPKLPVSDQFYRRLIWLHIFNVHVFGTQKHSYMYFFIEGKLKKGANTVCNFLLDSIQRELKLNHYNKIYLFSDSCGGQNKNYLFVSFLSLLSTKLQTEIQHVYPVRGHSYCSCDRNFGLYGQKKKSMETIETPDDYYQLVESARRPPFTIIKDSELTVTDFELLIPKEVIIPKDFHIRDAIKISYFPNNHIHVFSNYKEKPNDLLISSVVEFDDLLKTKPALPIGISKEKLNDVRTLLRYLSPNGQAFFNSFIENASLKIPTQTVSAKKSKNNVKTSAKKASVKRKMTKKASVKK